MVTSQQKYGDLKYCRFYLQFTFRSYLAKVPVHKKERRIETYPFSFVSLYHTILSIRTPGEPRVFGGEWIQRLLINPNKTPLWIITINDPDGDNNKTIWRKRSCHLLDGKAGKRKEKRAVLTLMKEDMGWRISIKFGWGFPNVQHPKFIESTKQNPAFSWTSRWLMRMLLRRPARNVGLGGGSVIGFYRVVLFVFGEIISKSYPIPVYNSQCCERYKLIEWSCGKLGTKLPLWS